MLGTWVRYIHVGRQDLTRSRDSNIRLIPRSGFWQCVCEEKVQMVDDSWGLRWWGKAVGDAGLRWIVIRGQLCSYVFAGGCEQWCFRRKIHGEPCTAGSQISNMFDIDGTWREGAMWIQDQAWSAKTCFTPCCPNMSNCVGMYNVLLPSTLCYIVWWLCHEWKHMTQISDRIRGKPGVISG